MKEKIKEALRRAKEGRESAKEITSQKSKKQKVIQRVLWSIGIGLFILVIIGYYLDLPTFSVITFIIWLCFLCPCGYISDKIDNTARQKYKEDYVMEILEFCPHCGEKIEPPGVFCGFCGKKIEQEKEKKKEEKDVEKKTTTSMEKQMPSGKSTIVGAPSLMSSEPVEIINMERKSQFRTMIYTGIIISIGFSLLFLFLGFDVQLFLIFLLILPLITTAMMIFMGFLMDYVTMHVKFRISNQGIELYIENYLYIDVKWDQVESIEIFKISFQGYFLKINLDTEFEIIPMQKLTLTKKKRKKIIEAVEYFANIQRIKILRENRIKPILETRGINMIYEDMNKFSRKHKYKRS